MQTYTKPLPRREYDVFWHWRDADDVNVVPDHVTAVSVTEAIKKLRLTLREDYSFKNDDLVIIEVSERA